MTDATHEQAHAPLRVLAIGAHPDDVELCCAETPVMCVQRGDSVTIAFLCKGDSASFDLRIGEGEHRRFA